jgi:hypothetical protein
MSELAQELENMVNLEIEYATFSGVEAGPGQERGRGDPVDDINSGVCGLSLNGVAMVELSPRVVTHTLEEA